MKAQTGHAGFCSKLLRPSPSRLLKGRTLVKDVTLWPQSHFPLTRAYQHVKRDISIPINQDGQFVVVAKELHTDDKGACVVRKGVL